MNRHRKYGPDPLSSVETVVSARTDASVEVDDDDDEFDRLGRLAGEELRLQAPADGPDSIVRTARRRRATMSAVVAGAAVAIVATGFYFASSSIDDQPAPIATVPAPPVPVPTVAPSYPDAAPIAAARTTTPGTWRAVSDPLGLAPDWPAATVWTGTEAIIIGWNLNDTYERTPLFAVAYDVGQDQWKSLADLPPAFDVDAAQPVLPTLTWTGSQVLAYTNQGAVYVYDVGQDRWEARAAADKSISLGAEDALAAVSARGVLARSSTGWWWYDNATDRWEPVAAPPDADQYATLVALDQDRIVAARIGWRITPAVFEIATRTWRTGLPAVKGPMSTPSRPIGCAANAGYLVCFSEMFGSLDGVVIDPMTGESKTFDLGNHSQTIPTAGLPWMTHAWKLLDPSTATWEDLPPSPYNGVDSFGAAVWTGSEILWFGGGNSAGGTLGATAAYTPLHVPVTAPVQRNVDQP